MSLSQCVLRSSTDNGPKVKIQHMLVGHGGACVAGKLCGRTDATPGADVPDFPDESVAQASDLGSSADCGLPY